MKLTSKDCTLISGKIVLVSLALCNSPLQWITVMWAVPFLMQDVCVVFVERFRCECIVPSTGILVPLALACGVLLAALQTPMAWWCMVADGGMRLVVFLSNKYKAGLWDSAEVPVCRRSKEKKSTDDDQADKVEQSSETNKASDATADTEETDQAPAECADGDAAEATTDDSTKEASNKEGAEDVVAGPAAPPKKEVEDCPEHGVCSICLQNLCRQEGCVPERDTKIAITRCGHTFHEACLSLATTHSAFCPNCRMHLFTGDEETMIDIFSTGILKDPALPLCICGGIGMTLCMDPKGARNAYRDFYQ